MTLKTVKVPRGMEEAFARAEKVVAGYFAKATFDPAKGAIGIFGERYVLVRSAALSCEFFGLVRELFGKRQRTEADAFARNLLFDLAHAIGRTDARDFHERMHLVDPVERLSAGPVHFAYTGWASVDILPASHAVAGPDFCLVYDHPYSFEADAWIAAEHTADFPVCVMNAGYSSGWCEESFGLPLLAGEIECRAHGGERCRFVMAPPAKLEERIREHAGGKGKGIRRAAYEIPDFFARKRAEDALAKSEGLYRTLAESSPDIVFIIGADGIMEYLNSRGASLLGRTPGEVVGRRLEDLFPAAEVERLWGHASSVVASGAPLAIDEQIELPDRRAWFSTNLLPLRVAGNRATAVMGILHDITARKQGEERLATFNECLAGFGLDPIANINRIVAACGELVGATCALYNRLEGGMLCSIGRWKTPPAMGLQSEPEGHICSDVIRKGGDDLVVVRNLLKSPYAKSDPNVLILNLETYVGRAVRLDGEVVGSFCCVWQRDYVPTDADARFFGVVATIIGLQERRAREQAGVAARLAKLEGEVDALRAELGRPAKDAT